MNFKENEYPEIYEEQKYINLSLTELTKTINKLGEQEYLDDSGGKLVSCLEHYLNGKPMRKTIYVSTRKNV